MRKFQPGEPVSVARLIELASENKNVYLLTVNRTKMAKVVVNMPFQSVYRLLKNKQICEAVSKFKSEEDAHKECDN